MDAVTFRGIERLVIVVGAIIFAYLGYKLFLAGIDKGPGKLEAETKFYKFVFSGVGPGVFFMAFGGIVLVTALFTGGAESAQSNRLPSTDSKTIEQGTNLKRSIN